MLCFLIIFHWPSSTTELYISFSLLPFKPQLLPFLFVLVDLRIVFDLRIEAQEHGIMWDMFGPNIKGKRCVRLLHFIINHSTFLLP